VSINSRDCQNWSDVKTGFRVCDHTVPASYCCHASMSRVIHLPVEVSSDVTMQMIQWPFLYTVCTSFLCLTPSSRPNSGGRVPLHMAL
jgi:hypothetical protein